MARSTPGLTANAAVESMLSMKYNCCSNVKLYFKNVRVCVSVLVQPYPPFPTTRVQNIANVKIENVDITSKTWLIMKL